jgi:hypothetical protein
VSSVSRRFPFTSHSCYCPPALVRPPVSLGERHAHRDRVDLDRIANIIRSAP